MKGQDILSLLGSQFHEAYGRPPEYFARAPGRVNLIGEHTDYNGCPVLPMALNREFTALVSGREDGEITVKNTDPQFQEFSFRIEEEIPHFDQGNWGNYCKAGVQTIIDYALSSGHADRSGLKGADVLVRGTVPPAAGLSSSSALVVASALLFMAVNRLEVPRPLLAQLLAEGEKYVGTQGGGMDQAASLLSTAGKALKIDFLPFQTRPVSMPGGYTVVVANSMVEAAKTRETMDKYNLRTIECGLGTAMLEKAFRLSYGRKVPKRDGAEERPYLLGDFSPANLGLSREETDAFIGSVLRRESYRLEEAAGVLGMSSSAARDRFCRRRDGSILPEPEGGFKIRQRVEHVMSEWDRVEKSAELLERGDAAGFGGLMNQSHASCRDLFEISCRELDVLTEAAREAGSAGSRLTGAGFGGCTVNLVKDSDIKRFTDELFLSYYRDYLRTDDTAVEAVIFPCKPGNGAEAGKIAGQ